MKCPKCGSENLQVTNQVETKGKDFSAGKGCLGYLLFGPLGILCGMCGQKKNVQSKTVWKCINCGTSFKDCETLREEIKGGKITAGAGIFLAIIGIIGGLICTIACIADGEALVGLGIGLGLIVFMGGLGAVCFFSGKKQADNAKAELKQNFDMDE